MNKRNQKILQGFFFCFLVIVFFTFCNNKVVNKTENYFKNLDSSVQYVGIQTCKKCHAAQYDSFIQTGMGKSFGLATKLKSAGNFSGHRPVFDPKKNMYYYPFWVGEEMYLREFRLKNGDTIHNRVEKIKYIIGSGQHTNSHLWEENGYLFQAPITFYTQKQQWDLPPGFESFNSGFTRKVDIECMSCHNAIPEVDKGSVNKFVKIGEGIDCERCHGPGSLHVKEKEAGILVNTKTDADRSIVNPKRLPWKLQMDVCQRCHLQGNNVLKSGKQFTDFRPGMPLHSVFEIYMPQFDRETDFVMAGHADRFQKSECFIQSNAKTNLEEYNKNINFTCINCHNPHVSVTKTNINKFNQVCNTCHAPKSEKSKLEKCRLPDLVLQQSQRNCVKCHMPSNTTGDIPHVTVHDHYIRKPSVVDRAGTAIRIGLYSVNNPTPNDSMQFLALISYYEKFDAKAFYLEQAAKFNVARENPELEIQYQYAHQNFKEIVNQINKVDLQTNNAWTNYRVAKALDKTGDLQKSILWYQQAWNFMKNNLEFGAEYANALIRNKQLGTANSVLQYLEKQQSKNELVLLNQGVLSLMQGNTAGAQARWKRLLQLYPDNVQANLYMAEVYLQTNSKSKAKEYAENALKIDTGSLRAKELIKRCD